MITFNNIVERFKVFAENHFFIETFSFGSPDDVDLSKFTSFPLMHLVYTGATYDAGTKTYNLEVYILDVPGDKTKKVDRQKEVVSDAEQCAEDIIADIKNGGNIFLFAQDYEVVNATTTPLEEETKNVLSGVLLDLSVAIPYEWDACNAPIDGVEPGGTEVTYARRGVLRMLTLDGATDVPSVRTIKVTNGTLTDDGDGVVTLDTGGVDTLAGLTDVDVTGVTDGQVLKYDDATGEWIPANDQSATSLGNLDDVSLGQLSAREALIYDGDNWVNDNVTKADVGLGNVDNTSDADKPVSTATQTALDAKADTSSVPTELNDLSDVSLTTPTANQALIYNATTSAFQALPNFTNRFEDEAETNKQSILPFPERVYTVKADGDGIFIDAQSDTPTAGKVIKRKIYQKTGFLESGAVIGDFTLIHTFADDTAYSSTESTFEGFRDGDTYGTPPFTLIQTWEEVTAAPSFTGLLNESYGSGAEAAYSTRRLNGNVTDCMVIRRASDSTTQTIGFDGSGNIDESAIETFCTGTTCTVYQWLDQSGNGNDATAAASTNEPTIYTGGALVKEKGKLALDFDGSGDCFDVSAFGSALSLPNSTFTVGKADTTGTFYLYGGASGTENTIRARGLTSTWEIGNPTFQNTGIAYDTNTHLFTGIHNASATLFVDGNSSGALSGAGSQSWQDVNIGSRYGDFTWNGKQQEFIIYNSAKSGADRTSIESNIGDYFTQNTPLLDTYSGAAAAYSLRLLDSSYVGSAVEVYNGSSYADIGFNVFGELDTVALADHCGSNDGFVSKWYDQSGNSNTAAQTTTSNMPKIYDGTTGVVTENGKPILDADTGGGVMTLSVSVSQPFTYNCVLRFGNTYDYAMNNNYLIDTTNSRTLVLGNDAANGVDFTGTQMNVFAVGNGATSSGKCFNSTNQPNAVTFNNTSGLTLTHILDRNDGGGNSVKMQELIIWNSDQDAAGNRAGIETNINTFYSIY